MEIVLALLLLFGGFTLGAVTSDKGADAEGSTPVIQAMRQSETTRCHFVRGSIYRDLTLPYPGKGGKSTSQAGDCGKVCPDE